MSRTVVVSPHLDDAVLSCGGRLADEPAHVITMFAGIPDDVGALPMWDRVTGATSSHHRVVDRLAVTGQLQQAGPPLVWAQTRTDT